MEDVALQAEHDELLQFVYMCPVGVVRMALNGDVQMMNPQAAQLLLPLTRTPVLQNLLTALGSCAPELRSMVDAFTGSRGSICQQHRIFVSRSGPGPRVVACSMLKIGPDCLMAVLQDVTKQVEQERELRQNESLFAALVAGVNDFVLFSLDCNGMVDSWNVFAKTQTGFAADTVLGRNLRVFFPSSDEHYDGVTDQIQDAAREGWSLRERWCVRADGSRYWCQILVAANRESEPPEDESALTPAPPARAAIGGFSVVLRDVTERHFSGEELLRLLTTDHLTGATNRARFFDLAELEIARRRRDGRPLSLIMLDIDHFKRINDRFGHPCGDWVLKRLVTLCRAQLRNRDVIARMGGEEFAILLPETAEAEAVRVAGRIRYAVESDVARPQIAGNDPAEQPALSLTVSLGVAAFNPTIDGVDALLKAADVALYEAKRAGRNQVRTAQPDHMPASA